MGAGCWARELGIWAHRSRGAWLTGRLGICKVGPLRRNVELLGTVLGFQIDHKNHLTTKPADTQCFHQVLLFFWRFKTQETDGLLRAFMYSRQDGELLNPAEMAAQPMQGRSQGRHISALLQITE